MYCVMMWPKIEYYTAVFEKNLCFFVFALSRKTMFYGPFGDDAHTHAGYYRDAHIVANDHVTRHSPSISGNCAL